MLPFGLKNAPASFQRLMNNVVKEIQNVQVYIDDIVVYNDTFDGHINDIRLLFDRLTKTKLTVNLAKSHFCKGQAKFLGYMVG